MKRALYLTLLILIFLTVATSLGLLMLKHAHSAVNLHLWLQQYWWAFAIWRYILLALLLWKWPKICHWYGKRKGLDEQTTKRLAKGRWWLLVFIIIFETVVIYGV